MLNQYCLILPPVSTSWLHPHLISPCELVFKSWHLLPSLLSNFFSLDDLTQKDWRCWKDRGLKLIVLQPDIEAKYIRQCWVTVESTSPTLAQQSASIESKSGGFSTTGDHYISLICYIHANFDGWQPRVSDWEEFEELYFVNIKIRIRICIG